MPIYKRVCMRIGANGTASEAAQPEKPILAVLHVNVKACGAAPRYCHRIDLDEVLDEKFVVEVMTAVWRNDMRRSVLAAYLGAALNSRARGTGCKTHLGVRKLARVEFVVGVQKENIVALRGVEPKVPRAGTSAVPCLHDANSIVTKRGKDPEGRISRVVDDDNNLEVCERLCNCAAYCARDGLLCIPSRNDDRVPHGP